MFDQTNPPGTPDIGVRWREEALERSRPLFEQVAMLEAAAGPGVFGPHHEVIYGHLNRLLTPEATIGVAGVYSSGKSTLLNTVARRALLPEGAKPSSAVPTHLKGGRAVRFEIVRAGPDGREFEHEIDEEALQRMRLDDAGAAPPRDARRIVCHGVLPETLDGFTLVDTRGALDSDGGAERTAEAAEREDWDGLVAVTLQNQDRTAVPEAEARFFAKLASGRRPLLVVVNTEFDEPLGEEEKAALWTAFVTRLRGGQAWRGQPLEEGGIFAVHLPTAKAVRLGEGRARGTAPGYEAFEKALVEAVARRRWPLKLSVCLDAVLPRTEAVCDEIAGEADGLRELRASEEEERKSYVSTATARLEACRAARSTLLSQPDAALEELRKDFVRAVQSAADGVAADLKARELKSISGLGDAIKLATKERRKAVSDEICKLVSEGMSNAVLSWMSGSDGKARVLNNNYEPAIRSAQAAFRSGKKFVEETSLTPKTIQKAVSSQTLVKGIDEGVREGISTTHGDMAGGVFIGGHVGLIAGSVGAAVVSATMTAAGIASVKTATSGAIKAALAHIIGTKVAAVIGTKVATLVGLAFTGWGVVALAGLVAAVGAAHAASYVSGNIRNKVAEAIPKLAPELASQLWDGEGEDKGRRAELAVELRERTDAVRQQLYVLEEALEGQRAVAQAALSRSEPLDEHQHYLETLRSIPGTPEEKAFRSGLPNLPKAFLVALDDAITRREEDAGQARRAHDDLTACRAEVVAGA